jgi:hypothetical protein
VNYMLDHRFEPICAGWFTSCSSARRRQGGDRGPLTLHLKLAELRQRLVDLRKARHGVPGLRRRGRGIEGPSQHPELPEEVSLVRAAGGAGVGTVADEGREVQTPDLAARVHVLFRAGSTRTSQIFSSFIACSGVRGLKVARLCGYDPHALHPYSASLFSKPQARCTDRFFRNKIC